jgi:hypothetical protein
MTLATRSGWGTGMASDGDHYLPELHLNYQAPLHVPQRFSPQGLASPQRRTPRARWQLVRSH